MKFSALLCLYIANDPVEVREALNSAITNQNMPPMELIVVYDGVVSGEIKTVIQQFKDTIPTKILEFKENKGHGAARAAGLLACSYEWVAIIDADDISLPNRFEILVREIKKNPQLAVIGGGLTEFSDTEEGRKTGVNRQYPNTYNDICKYMQTRSPIAQPTCMLRREAILDVGNYLTWYNNEDYYLWIRLVTAGYKLQNVPESLLLFRTSPDSYLRRGGFKYWLNEVRLQLYSLKQGTTSFSKFLSGVLIRFVIQVLMPNRLRAYIYKLFLR